jgi:thymidylate synthase
MREFLTLGDAYEDGLRAVLSGTRVESVQDPLSKASNFGQGDRPSRELLCHLFVVEHPANCLVSGPYVQLHLPYCFGLLAFALSGRNDLSSLRYYRPGATEFSDDGWTLSGAFGARLRGLEGEADQLAAILVRLSADPASRRTYAAILKPEDNLRVSREYPCAAGIQLFLRNDRLTMLTVMRAQQAFTILPYDAFLFMSMQLLLSARLGVSAGPYMHFAGTFHVYESEETAIRQTLDSGVNRAVLPLPPSGPIAAAKLIYDLVALEVRLRGFAQVGDTVSLGNVANESSEDELLDVARRVLASFALRKLGLHDECAEVLAGLPTDLRGLC